MTSVAWYKDMNTLKAHKTDELLAAMAHLEPNLGVDKPHYVPGTADGWLRLCSNGTIATFRGDP